MTELSIRHRKKLTYKCVVQTAMAESDSEEGTEKPVTDDPVGQHVLFRDGVTRVVRFSKMDERYSTEKQVQGNIVASRKSARSQIGRPVTSVLVSTGRSSNNFWNGLRRKLGKKPRKSRTSRTAMPCIQLWHFVVIVSNRSSVLVLKRCRSVCRNGFGECGNTPSFRGLGVPSPLLQSVLRSWRKERC